MGSRVNGTLQADQFIGSFSDVNPFSRVLYVDGTSGNNKSGFAPDEAFTTLQLALAASAAGDTFIIAPGTYTMTATFSPLARQTYKAAVVNQRYPTVSITATSALTGDIISLDVSGTKWVGIEFLAGHANQATLVDIADAADVNGAHFDRCVFNGADKTTVVGIQADDATFIPTGVLVENCIFRDLTGTIVDIGVLGMPYSLFQNNLFALDVNSGTVFALADTTAFATGKGLEIKNNNFLGFDATKDEVAITIAGTEDTTAPVLVTNNNFAYFAVAAVTIDKVGFATIQNYTGDATGGLLTDVGT